MKPDLKTWLAISTIRPAIAILPLVLLFLFPAQSAFGGSIVAWGDNYDGQCNIPSPNSGFIAVAAGGYHSLELKQDGSILAYGWNEQGQCSIPTPNSGFMAIAGACIASVSATA